jgi:hypothetical protein
MGFAYRSFIQHQRGTELITEALEVKSFGIHITNMLLDFTNIASSRYHAPVINGSHERRESLHTMDDHGWRVNEMAGSSFL